MASESEKSETPEPSGAAARRGHSWGGEVGGLLLLALSAIFVIGGVRLGLGVPTRLGTGAFPFLTGIVLAIMAVFICIEERRGDADIEAPDWIAFLAIGGALAVFAASANRIGLVPATFLTIVVASLPDRNLPMRGKAILGAIVSLACWGLFIELLNLPFKPFMGL